MNNSNIHYRYVISFLVLTIILILALWYYQVPDLVNKLSFALTLSSLLLAILAIFYTIISGYKQDNQFTKLIETNSELKSSANQIKSVSENLNSAFNDLPIHFKNIGHKIDNLAERYSSVNQNDLLSKGEREEDDSRTIHLNIDNSILWKIVGNLHFDAMAILYLFMKSTYKSKSIEFSFFKSIEIETNYAVGFLNGFQSTGLINFKLHQNYIIPIKCDKILGTELENMLESIVAVIDVLHSNTLKNRMQQINTFLT